MRFYRMHSSETSTWILIDFAKSESEPDPKETLNRRERMRLFDFVNFFRMKFFHLCFFQPNFATLLSSFASKKRLSFFHYFGNFFSFSFISFGPVHTMIIMMNISQFAERVFCLVRKCTITRCNDDCAFNCHANNVTRFSGCSHFWTLRVKLFVF